MVNAVIALWTIAADVTFKANGTAYAVDVYGTCYIGSTSLGTTL